MSQSEVWEDAKRAEALGKERAQLGETVITLQTVSTDLDDLTDISELAFEENDEATLLEIDAPALQPCDEAIAFAFALRHVSATSFVLKFWLVQSER